MITSGVLERAHSAAPLTTHDGLALGSHPHISLLLLSRILICAFYTAPLAARLIYLFGFEVATAAAIAAAAVIVAAATVAAAAARVAAAIAAVAVAAAAAVAAVAAVAIAAIVVAAAADVAAAALVINRVLILVNTK